MKYAYEDLGPDQFETLIVCLCQELLGISTQGFAKGPDGGRDAKFVGTAEYHPSKSRPWSGTTIIQAKHTNGYNRNFSESDFFSKSSTNTVLGKEIPRIRNLRRNNQLDHYMLFANRRLAANAETEISSHISVECGVPVPSIYLCGIQQLELWLKKFDQVPAMANLDPVDSPLIVSPDELAEVVHALAFNKDEAKEIIASPPGRRTAYEEKNELNNMTTEYAKNFRMKYLKEAAQIKDFLSAPENAKLLGYYEAVIEEFNFKIIAKRQKHQTFDEIVEHLCDTLFGRDAILRQNKKLTRAMLFYMYWNCDIGEAADASSE